MIINCHGFNSVGNNNTSYQLRKYFPEIKIISPTYTVYNFKMGFAELSKIVTNAIKPTSSPENILFTGSSTGGLYAEMLAKKFNGKVVAINPVTNPDILTTLLGENENYKTGGRYEFTLADLKTFDVVKHDLENISRLVLVEKNETVINHDKTREFYKSHGKYIEFDGDSHQFTFWDEALPEIHDFYNDVIG